MQEFITSEGGNDEEKQSELVLFSILKTGNADLSSRYTKDTGRSFDLTYSDLPSVELILMHLLIILLLVVF